MSYVETEKPVKKGLTMTNREYARTDKLFKECCDAAEVTPNKKQASQFRAKSGKAYEIGRPIINGGE